MKKLALAILILVGLGIALGALLTGDEDSEVRLTGIVSANEAFVASEISGRLKELRVSEGDFVESGQVVAVLATDEIDASRQSQLATIEQLTARVAQGRERVHLERERVKSQIDSAAAKQNAAESQREEVRAELEQARKEWERAEQLFAQGLIPHHRVERQEAMVEVVEAKLQTAEDLIEAARAELEIYRASERQVRVMEQEVQQTQAQVQEARADLEQITVRLGYTELKSPLTGIVSLRVAREGEFVPAGAPVVTVLDLTDVWVRAQVEETLVGRLAIGQPLDVVLASDERVTGRVTFISPEGEFATQRDVDRVKRDIRTFGIKVAVENPGGTVHPGMTATVLLPSDGSAPAPVQPMKETSLPNEPQKASEESPPHLAGTAIAASVAPPSLREAAGTKGPGPKAPSRPSTSVAAAPRAGRSSSRPQSPEKPVTSTSPLPRPSKVETADETPARPAVEVADTRPPQGAPAPPRPSATQSIEEALKDPDRANEADLEKYLLEVLSDDAPPPEPQKQSQAGTTERASARVPCSSGSSKDCAAAASAGPKPPSFRLEGISISDGRRVAIINGARVFEGESVDGARVSSIADSEVRLELDGRTITLRF